LGIQNSHELEQSRLNIATTQLNTNRVAESAGIHAQNTQDFRPTPRPWPISSSIPHQQSVKLTVPEQTSTQSNAGTNTVQQKHQLAHGQQNMRNQKQSQNQEHKEEQPEIKQNLPQTNEASSTSAWSNPTTAPSSQNNQLFFPQAPTWQASNQQTVVETTTKLNDVNYTQDVENQQTQNDKESLNNEVFDQETENQQIVPASYESVLFEPDEWEGIPQPEYLSQNQNTESSASLNDTQIQSEGHLKIKHNSQQQTFPYTNEGFLTQEWLNQVPEVNIENNQHFFSGVPRQQAYHNVQQHQQFKTVNQPTTVETTTKSNEVTDKQDLENQQVQNEPEPWEEKPQPDATPSSELQSQNENVESSVTETSTATTNSPIESTQQVTINQNSFQQTQSWPHDQQLQNPTNPWINSESLKVDNTYNFNTRLYLPPQVQPWSPTGSFAANPFLVFPKVDDTARQEFSKPYLQGWQPSLPFQQQQFHTYQYSTVPQPPTLGSLPSVYPGRWYYYS
ncbi:unnamed protein product, partial [Rotaria magnacalcarata]